MHTSSSIGVIGIGHIGGSIARLLSREAEVFVFDRDANALESAGADGLCRVGGLRELVNSTQLIICAAPTPSVYSIASEVAKLAALDAKKILFCDVSSVKGSQFLEVESLRFNDGESAFEFVSLHPMAGREVGGYSSSDPEIIKGARWAISFSHDVSPDSLVEVLALLVQDMDGEVIALAPETHDEAVALISHLPHVIALALLDLLGREGGEVAASLAAGSFLSATRVAKTSSARIYEMVAPNSGFVHSWLERLVAELRVVTSLVGEDSNALLGWIEAVQGEQGIGPLDLRPTQTEEDFEELEVSELPAILSRTGARGKFIRAFDLQSPNRVVLSYCSSLHYLRKCLT